MGDTTFSRVSVLQGPGTLGMYFLSATMLSYPDGKTLNILPWKGMEYPRNTRKVRERYGKSWKHMETIFILSILTTG